MAVTSSSALEGCDGWTVGASHEMMPLDVTPYIIT